MKIIILMLGLLMISSVMAENLWEGNKLSIRGSDKTGYFTLNGVNTNYDSAKLSLSVSRVRRDEGRGSLVLSVNRKERISLSLLPREGIDIIKWNDNKVKITQKAKIRYTNYNDKNNKVRYDEIIDVNYTIYLDSNKATIDFNLMGEELTLEMIDLKYYKCIKDSEGRTECIRY